MMSNPVIELLLRRAAAGSHPPHRDGCSLALCIEGGSMRGVVSAGMVLAIEQLGLLRCFDIVYGSSAGAMNGAYLLAGQAAFGTTIYYENINNRNFIDFLRPLRGRSIVDLDFLVDQVMVRAKPLDVSRIIESPIPLVAVATDSASGERAVFRTFTDGADLRHALRAGATMPVVAGPPYRYRGQEYFDALLTEPIPVPIAEADGHTHILALLTRPYEEKPRTLSLAERLVVGGQLRRISADLAARYLHRGEAYSQLLKAISSGTCPQGKARVAAIRPLDPVVGKLERDRSRLVAGAARGLQAVLSTVVGKYMNAVETLSAHDDQGHRFESTWSQLPAVEELRSAHTR